MTQPQLYYMQLNIIKLCNILSRKMQERKWTARALSDILEICSELNSTLFLFYLLKKKKKKKKKHLNVTILKVSIISFSGVIYAIEL